MPSRRVYLAAATVSAAAIALGVVWATGDAALRIDQDDRAQVQLGSQLYLAYCASCHGKSLEGQPKWQDRRPDGRLPAPPHDASGHTWHHPDAVLFALTKEGLGPFAPAGYQSDMPAFKGTLSDAQIAAVIAFIKSTWPEDIQRRQADITEISNEE